jgi:uncharacterized membrane protein
MGGIESLLALIAVAYGIFLLLSPFVVGALFKRIRKLEQRLGKLESATPGTPPAEPVLTPTEPTASAAPPKGSVRPAAEPPKPTPFKEPVPAPAAAATRRPAVSIEEPSVPSKGVTGLATAPSTEPAKTDWPSVEALSSDEMVERVKKWLAGGHTLARIGVIVLFFGVAFLLKYAADQGWLPIELRLTGAALGSLTLLVIGWRLRQRRRVYGLILQGGGVGIVYLTVFAAVSMYRLLPPIAGQGLMVVLVALAAALAVLQNARSLVVLATTGGFLAPVLVSAGGSHVTLFSYYAILNAGILGIAWFKAWRELNLVGFVFTFVIGSAWGYRYYQPEFFATTEPFLLIFFLFYVGVPILFALRAPTNLKGYVDGPLVFGVPLVAAALQAALVRDFEYGLAISAFGVGLFYVLLASALWKASKESLRLLVETFLALGVAFATVAIPFAVDGRWTGAAWALEGAALVWIGVRQRRLLPRLSGLVVQVAAGLAFLSEYDAPIADLPVLNSLYLSGLMLAVGGLVSAYHLYAGRNRLLPTERESSAGALTWGLLWWTGAGLFEIWQHVALDDRLEAALVFVAATALACSWLESRLDWRQMRYPPMLLLPFVALAAIALFTSQDTHPFARLGLMSWPLVLATHYWLLRRYEGDWPGEASLLGHAGGLWLTLFIFSWELAWQTAQLVPGSTTWPLVAWAVIPLIAVELVTARGQSLGWPIGPRLTDYLDYGLAPAALFLTGWVLYASSQRGDPWPLPYLPLLNPLELMQIAALIGVASWSHRTLPSLDPSVRVSALAALGFLILNTIIGRSTHFIIGVPYTLRALYDSAHFQTATSITWTLVALALTALATRRSIRSLWLVGIGLLALVVVKLFLIDLAEVGTIARIVSFIIVGILILVVAYFSPLPPAQSQEHQP